MLDLKITGWGEGTLFCGGGERDGSTVAEARAYINTGETERDL